MADRAFSDAIIPGLSSRRRCSSNGVDAAIIQGDCLEEMKRMPCESVDLIGPTSPPYWDITVYATNGDPRDVGKHQTYEEYLSMLRIRIDEGVKLLKRGGYMIILVGTVLRDEQQHELYIDTLGICREGRLTAKVRRIRDLTGTDYAVICRKDGKVLKRVHDTVDKHVIDLRKWQDERNKEHPAPFSYALAEVMIAKYSKPGDVVVDPFMGSGTTILVAKCMRRKVIGIDLSEKYCEDARRHLAELEKNAWYQRYRSVPINIKSIFNT